MADVSEALVLARCQEGEQEGFRQFFDMFRGYIYSLCYRMTGNREEVLDLCQESYLAIFRGIKTVRPGCPLKPWVRRVTLNVCLNHRRRWMARIQEEAVAWIGHLEPGNVDSLSGIAGATQDGPARQVELKETRDMLSRAMEALSPEQRMVVILFHQEGLSYREICDETGWPLGTVKTNLFRARKVLARVMGDYRLGSGGGG
ncbi:MAG: RNA polymerase sigma factor [Bacillota bacterium]|jgi:RNA polymerase sigma-70 factor (ECF subfamily)|nr:RNA polymerase sigma factor [Candidatus Fermentithermobacillaceae bacterium]